MKHRPRLGYGFLLALCWLPASAAVAAVCSATPAAGARAPRSAALESLSAHFEAALDVALSAGDGPLPGRWRLGVYRDGRERAVFGRDPSRARSGADTGAST